MEKFLSTHRRCREESGNGNHPLTQNKESGSTANMKTSVSCLFSGSGSCLPFSHPSPTPSTISSKHSSCFLALPQPQFPCIRTSEINQGLARWSRTSARATLDEKDQITTDPLVVQREDDEEKEEEKQPTEVTLDVAESIQVLKNAAKTRKVAKEEVLSALSLIEKAKLDPSKFLSTLGGSESPGRTWMLIFTAEKKLKGGRYFPLTAVQRFDAAGKRIENGVYLGSLGYLTFEGRLTWKTRILAFIFERIRIKIGPFNPLEIGLGQSGDREPTTKTDPFFIWFYVDEEIAVARGRSGGTAFWCRCRRAANF